MLCLLDSILEINHGVKKNDQIAIWHFLNAQEPKFVLGQFFNFFSVIQGLFRGLVIMKIPDRGLSVFNLAGKFANCVMYFGMKIILTRQRKSTKAPSLN